VNWPLTVRSDSPAATREVAARLAPLCVSGDIVLLIGDLGAGKTVFAQGFAAALGVAGPVTSPTFALVRQYRCAAGASVETLLHADVYRTSSLPEVVDLALAELVEDDALALVEWGDLAAPALGDSALAVTLTVPASAASPPDGLADGLANGAADEPADQPADERIITIAGRGRWASRAGEVAGVLPPAGAGALS
jgi:tRNA threonylcarbamoyladenosine biosynthesis protein TsaE